MAKYESNTQIIEHPIVSSITNEIPVLRSVCNYWRETIRQSREVRLTEFLNDIAERVAKLEDDKGLKIEKDHLGSDDYFNTIEQLTEFAVKTNDVEKIKYLKDFAVNYSTNQRPDIRLKDVYLGLVNQLSGMHFVVLDIIFDKQKNLSNIDLISLADMPDRDESLNLNDLVTKTEMDGELTLTLLYSLSNIGLIAINSNSISNPNVIIEPIGLKLMTFLTEMN